MASSAVDQGRRHRRVAADRRGPDQLVAAALLLGAGVPADQEHAHQAGDDRAERRRLPGRPARRCVFSARAGPAIAMKAALPSMLAAARSNSAWVV